MAEKRKRSDAPAEGVKTKKSKSDKKPADDDFIAVPEVESLAEYDTSSKKERKEKKEKKAKKDKVEKKEKKEKKESKERKEKKEKKEKKSKSKSAEDEDEDEPAAETPAPEPEAPASDKKAKKSKKAAAAPADDDAAAAPAQPEQKGKAGRHIVFVGNLPYTASEPTIRKHFAHLKPSSVRCLTKDRVENTCRGFAFVEFSNSTHMRTCLDKMHHSLFDDGLSPARKINVLLTAGGGGAKSDNRKEKIKARNIQLDENRAKRIHKENEAKKGNAATNSTAEESGIHPSRLAMLES